MSIVAELSRTRPAQAGVTIAIREVDPESAPLEEIAQALLPLLELLPRLKKYRLALEQRVRKALEEAGGSESWAGHRWQLAQPATQLEYPVPEVFELLRQAGVESDEILRAMRWQTKQLQAVLTARGLRATGDEMATERRSQSRLKKPEPLGLSGLRR